ncbi:uncharacterized protein ACLA_013970 [Aspergillus clavatus NRRL 1]|uniref:MACPF domain-containing protein n=1 Tax=Aspergillus clavatus (strain ATCC 1007 / CBS 513.65 / DSM 816 / NCTC 3887 / NRRL 1 / QM 1276 / 107) TaxID=344612 RepID=A1CB42_ASPCL|nr:uncharacterized protein ACLA_013970 [Aspergillus clavatus NRRL 1]EAW12960.1 hypothetical protein ACLA_013970 [Aspergillus clavatus NRRL 1]
MAAAILDADTFDPLIPRVAQQALTRSPIRLPWQARILPLGMFFRSVATVNDYGGGNPFAPQSAFDAKSLSSTPVMFTAYDGNGSFRSSEATGSSTSTDHLGVGGGIGVDLIFLEASVSVQYDRDVLTNRDSAKVSVTTSYRAGSVAFARPPELSEDAFRVLYSKGLDEFKAIFGDYYVGGYRIGGDASVLFSTDASSRSETETKSVKLSVESWFGDYHKEWSSSSTRTEHQAEVRVSAYSTLEQAIIGETVKLGTARFQAVIEQGRGIHRRAQGLDDSISKLLTQIGVRKGGLVTQQQCMQLCQSGVVAELLLMPVECLRQVRHWTLMHQ